MSGGRENLEKGWRPVPRDWQSIQGGYVPTTANVAPPPPPTGGTGVRSPATSK